MRRPRPGPASFLLAALLALCLPRPGIGALGVSFRYAATGRYKLVERSDFSKYVDGAYLGHVYRETRALLDGEPEAGGVRYRGGFLVFEETLRDAALVSRRVEEEIPADFLVASDGGLELLRDEGYPSLRGFPAFPAGPVAPGESWQAEGVRVADPENSGRPTRIPILAEYVYRGLSSYKGREAHSISAKFATRYKSGQDRKGDPELRSASGTHDATILLDAATGAPLLIRDSLDETFVYASGRSVRLKGFLLVFYDATLALDYGAATASLRRALSGGGPGPATAASAGAGVAPSGGAAAAAGPGSASGTAGSDGAWLGAAAAAGPASDVKPGAAPAGGEGGPGAGTVSGPASSGAGPGAFLVEGGPELDLGAGVSAVKAPEGLLLTVKDLRFVADGDAVLPEERWRLDAIADALKGIPGRSFLVGGHTASVGRPADEMALSIRRAKRVVDELAARGIPAGRLLYRGYGATKPLVPNDSEANRARNRRVEILVLED